MSVLNILRNRNSTLFRHGLKTLSQTDKTLILQTKYLHDNTEASRYEVKRQGYESKHKRQGYESEEQSSWTSVFGVAIGTAAFVSFYNRKQVNAAAKDVKKLKSSKPEEFCDGLPVYEYNDVSKHTTNESRVWVTYKYGVYDITDFAATHPGGKQILEAAGGAIDPFWDLYQQHNNPEVEKMLEEMRIGNYKDGGLGEKSDNLWGNEPKRDPQLIMRSERPCNAETPKKLLGESFITKNHLFYVRHHLPVPEVDLQNYQLVVRSSEGGGKVMTLRLDDIKRFPKHTVTAALMCAGNRRSQMNTHKQTKGLAWGPGAVGNAVWSGARLRDVLQAAGVTSDENMHVQFAGLDMDATGKPYGASIPLSIAMDERKDVLLAYEMNGHPIPKDHGAPIRVFIPGTVGARCVKWLSEIKVSPDESPSHWQQFDYRGFNPSIDPSEKDYMKSTSIQNLPVTSAILSPEDGSAVAVNNGFVEAKGYAWSGGGQKIVRVDVSCDGGRTWQDGEIVQQDKTPAGRHWAWTLWSVKLPVQRGQKEMEIWVKAVDSNYNNQPDNVENIWNTRGVLNNSFDKIKIKITR